MPEQPESQAAEAFDEPPREEIPGISRGHVQYMESSDADEAWCIAGMHHVILHTIGRKSGNEHKVALPYWLDRDGNRIVVASFSGAPEHPSWFHNLVANPDTVVEIGTETIPVRARVLEGEEREAVWTKQKQDVPVFADYEQRSAGIREIPVILFERR